MTEERCPVCGALSEHHEVQHQNTQASPEAVASSCSAEADKIRSLVADLLQTLEANGTEVQRLEAERQVERQDLNTASARLRENLQPRVQAALQKLRGSQGIAEKVRRAIELNERIRELKELRDGTQKGPTESRIIYCQSRQREDCFQKAVIKRGLRRIRRSALRARSSSSQ